MNRLGRLFHRPDRARAEIPQADLQAIVARLDGLEAMVEGLQDSVDRQTRRQDDRLDEFARQLEPGELARSISADARKRGL
jgi:hypothetical protein